MLHDIRDQIPRTDQTNPSKFPAYEFKPYPRMMLDANGKPYLKADKSCAIVQDAAEEAMFHADPGQFGVKSVKVPATGLTNGGIAALTGESEDVIRLRAELAALKAAPVVERKKPGRPAKPKTELPADLK